MAGTTLGTAYVQILPSTQGMAKTISQALSGSSMSKVGQGMGAAMSGGLKGKLTGMFSSLVHGGGLSSISGGIKSSAADGLVTGLSSVGTGAIAGALAAAGVGVAVAGIVKKGISEGAKLQQSTGGIETLFGPKAAKTVEANAAKAFKSVGVSANEYMEQVTSFSASMIQSLGGDTTKAAKYSDMAMRDMSDNANKMGTNLGSIQYAYQGFAKQNYTMLDNLKLGYGGTKAEMQRLVSDASKLAGRKLDMSQYADVVEAIHLIQQKMKITGTTALEAETTITGAMGMMKAAALDFFGALATGDSKKVGQAFVNMFQTAANFLLNNIAPMAGKILANLGNLLITGLNSLTSWLMGGGIQKAFAAFTAAFNQNGPAITTAVILGVARLAAALAKALLALGVQLLKIGGQLFGELIDGMFGAGTFAKITGGIATVYQAVVTGFRNIVNGARVVINGIKAVFSGPFNAIRAIVTTVLSAVRAAVMVAVAAIKKAFSGLSSVAAFVARIFNGVKNAILHPITTAKAMLSRVITTIKNILTGNWSFPHIKIPHISVSGGKVPWGIGGKGTKPSISISYYKEGGVFTRPTLLGGSSVVGEAGAEAVLPLSSFYRNLDRITARNMSGETTIIMNVYGAQGQDVSDLADIVADKIVSLGRRKAAMLG